MSGLIICDICETKAEPHPHFTHLCVACAETDWYALSNGISHVMSDGTLYDPDLDASNFDTIGE